MDFLTPEITQHLVALFGAILLFILELARRAFTNWTGIQIEQKHMQALHSALMTGAEVALRDGPDKGIARLKTIALIHARESVPDAIAALVPGDGVLDRLAERFVLERLSRITS